VPELAAGQAGRTLSRAEIPELARALIAVLG
jgi:hypothetical protein